MKAGGNPLHNLFNNHKVDPLTSSQRSQASFANFELPNSSRDGPAILDRLSSGAASIISLFLIARGFPDWNGPLGVSRVSGCSQLSSIEKVSSSHRITALSTTFCNS